MFLGYDDEILSIAIHGKGDRHDWGGGRTGPVGAGAALVDAAGAAPASVLVLVDPSNRVGRSAASAVPDRPLHLSPGDAPSLPQLPALRILIAKIRLSPFWIPAWG